MKFVLAAVCDAPADVVYIRKVRVADSSDARLANRARVKMRHANVSVQRRSIHLVSTP